MLVSGVSPLSLVLALLPLAGCPASLEEGEGEEDVGESGTESGESGTGESESAGEQGESESAGETGTPGETGTGTAGESTAGETGTAGETTAGETETTGDPGIEEACAAACEVFSSCFEPFPDCVDECVAEFSQTEGECLDGQLALASCIGGLSCEELGQYVESSPEPYPCQAEEQAVEQACEGDVCEAGVGIGENPGECSFEYICPEDPIYEVVCDGSSCSCLEDGVEVGGCSEAAAFCGADDFNAAADECCGWTI